MEVPHLVLIVFRVLFVLLSALALNELPAGAGEMPGDLLDIISIGHVTLILFPIKHNMVDDVV
jgi:hypothetical protein